MVFGVAISPEAGGDLNRIAPSLREQGTTAIAELGGRFDRRECFTAAESSAHREQPQLPRAADDGRERSDGVGALAPVHDPLFGAEGRGGQHRGEVRGR